MREGLLVVFASTLLKKMMEAWMREAGLGSVRSLGAVGTGRPVKVADRCGMRKLVLARWFKGVDPAHSFGATSCVCVCGIFDDVTLGSSDVQRPQATHSSCPGSALAFIAGKQTDESWPFKRIPMQAALGHPSTSVCCQNAWEFGLRADQSGLR